MGKGESRKPTHLPRKTEDSEKDSAVELQAEELEERIAPIKTFNNNV